MKVYLAKSNRANPTTVSEVRHALAGYDCEIVEYLGGGYHNAPLLASDLLIVVLEDIKTGIIGKGLAEQIADFQRIKKEVIAVTDSSNAHNIRISKVATVRLMDKDDYIFNSQVILNETKVELEDFIRNKNAITMLS